MRTKRYVYILLICTIVASCTSAPAEVMEEIIYSHDFNGPNSVNLHGLPPDIDNNGGGNTWIAHSSWKANGASGNYSSAALPFHPEYGYVYQLSVTFRDVMGDNDWLALGYAYGSSTHSGSNGDRFIDNPTYGWPWMLRRGNAATDLDQMLLGPGTYGGAQNINNTLDHSLDVDFMIELDTRNPYWKARWYQKLTTESTYSLVGEDEFYQHYGMNPYIYVVGLAAANYPPDIEGYVDNFLLKKLWTSLSIRVNPDDVSTYAGMSAQMNVVFQSHTPPIATWYHIDANMQDNIVDGNDPDINIVLDYDSQSEEYTSTLSIANTDQNDAGWYYCSLINDDNSPLVSDTALLEVKEFASHWPLDADTYLDGHYMDIQDGHHATVTGIPDFVEGINGAEGTAINVDPQNSWASSPDFELNSSMNEFSISIWSKWQGAQPGEVNNLSVVSVLGGTSNLGNVDNSIGNWRHLCITYDGRRGRIYINGQEVYEGYWPEVDLGNLYTQIGHNDGNNFFNGAIDEIKLYSFALRDFQVGALYSKNGECILDYPYYLDASGSYGVPDCAVNFYDYSYYAPYLNDVEALAIFAEGWLSCGSYPDCD